MFSPILQILPPLLNAQIPSLWIEWPSPTFLPLAIVLGCAASVAALTWKILHNFESAPRKRHGARAHAFDRAS
jgi:hypothetical protein